MMPGRGLAWVLCVGLAAGVLDARSVLPEPTVARTGRWRTVDGHQRDAAGMLSLMRRLVAERAIGALSVAVVEGGRPTFTGTLGTVDGAGRIPADDRTVFRAASLTKPVFAYLVMRLVDRGVLDLDRALHRYLPRPLREYEAWATLAGDPRIDRLTARLLLSHQGGLPNWRRDRPDGPIRFLASPGDRFSYSGEGYTLLQFVIEQVTGRDLPALARDEVFSPLGMDNTSFLWEPRFDGRFAVDLDSGLGRLIETTRDRANAAASIITNAADYGTFLGAVMEGRGLTPATLAAWRAPQVALTSRSLFSAPGTDGGANRHWRLAWTPGWGTFEDTHGQALFHVGLEEGCENFAELYPDRRLGIVFLSRMAGPVSFSAELVDYAIGGSFSPLEWLEYGPAPARGLPWLPLLLALLVLGGGGVLVGVIRLRAATRRG